MLKFYSDNVLIMLRRFIMQILYVASKIAAYSWLFVWGLEECLFSNFLQKFNQIMNGIKLKVRKY